MYPRTRCTNCGIESETRPAGAYCNQCGDGIMLIMGFETDNESYSESTEIESRKEGHE